MEREERERREGTRETESEREREREREVTGGNMRHWKQMEFTKKERR